MRRPRRELSIPFIVVVVACALAGSTGGCSGDAVDRSNKPDAAVQPAPQEAAQLPPGTSAPAVPAYGTPLKVDRAQIPTGRWSKARRLSEDSELSAEQRELARKLETLGYMSGSQQQTASGVTVYNQAKAESGLNLYTSGHGPEAVLADMNGKPLHTWSKDIREAWPEFPWHANPNYSFWRRAHLFENGDILAIYEGVAMVKLDRNSNILWVSRRGEHHDMEVMEDGTIYTLTRRPQIEKWIDAKEPVLVDYIEVLDADGKLLREVSILEALRNSAFKFRLDTRPVRTGDIFHTNSVFVLDDSMKQAHPQFADADVLVSLNALGTIAVLDLEKEQVVWMWNVGLNGGVHDPDPLPGGRVLIFNNRNPVSGSRVFELQIDSLTQPWSFEHKKDKPFFSLTCGAVQRLPNGNTLITESDAGRAFETTTDGEIVWEFYNPHAAGEEGEYVATLFELVRLPKSFPTDWLGK